MPFCTNCGQPYTQPLKFCTACGAAIAPVADVPPVTRPTIPAQPTALPANATVEKPNTSKRPFNYKPLLLLLIVGGAAFTAYKFFFAPNLKKEGTAAAQMACNCNEKRNAAWPVSYQTFLTASVNRAFISNDEILACVDSLAAQAEAAYDSCSGEAKNLYATASKKYVDENSNLFNDAYLKALNECHSKGADFNSLFSAGRNEAGQKLRGNIGAYRPKEPVETAKEIVLPPQVPEKTAEKPAPPVETNQSEMVQQFIRFFEAENSIASVADIENVLDYYSYPVRRNFNLTNAVRERLQKMYKSWFVVKYHYHKRYNYQNRIKEILLADGRTRLEVTFTFEKSVNADGSNSEIQTVSNAYIFNTDGKIESVGLATDKNL